MLKLIHNKFIGKFLAVALGLITAAYFSWGFYYFGEWVGHQFLEFPGGPLALGIVCASIMCIAVLYSFFYWEYAREDVESYEDDRGDGSFESSLNQLKWAVRLMEVFSLLFRWWILQWNFAGLIMVLIGIALLWLSHILGKVLHAQTNAPHDVQAERIMNEAGMQLWSGAPKLLKRMSASQLKRIAQGDPRPLDEVKDISERDRQDTESRREERRRERQQQRGQNRKFVTGFLQGDPTPSASPDGYQDFSAAQGSKAGNLSNGVH